MARLFDSDLKAETENLLVDNGVKVL